MVVPPETSVFPPFAVQSQSQPSRRQGREGPYAHLYRGAEIFLTEVAIPFIRRHHSALGRDLGSMAGRVHDSRVDKNDELQLGFSEYPLYGIR
jgi:hypothetical protein